MSINDTIKEISQKVAEGYLLFGNGTNDEISTLYNSGEIENKEVLKRVCELVNQNIYLSLINNPETDRSNIVFDKAMYDSIINGKEVGMDAYKTQPKDYKDGMYEIVHVAEQIKVASPSDYEIRNYSNRLTNMSNSLKSVIADCEKVAEQSYAEIKRNVKNSSHSNESIDDMTKLASDYLTDFGYGHDKIASAFSLIEKELSLTGVVLNKGITKVASESINFDSEFFSPIEKLASSIDMITAANEVIENVEALNAKIKA